MTLLGGMRTFYGPTVGALVLILLNQQIVSYTAYWPLVLGVILVVLLLGFPGALAGATELTGRRLWSARRPRAARPDHAVPRLRGRLHRDRTRALLESLGLGDRAGEVAGFLAQGAQKQLELGLALALEPDVLLLDEPTAGMSATETRETIRLIERVARERGLTLLFTEHDMEVVFSIAQKITVLHQGRVIADGPPAAVRADA